MGSIHVNNYQFNPRIADVPSLEIKLTSAPDLAMVYSEGGSERQSIGTEYGESHGQVSSRSWGGSQSKTIEMTHTTSVEVTATIKPIPGVETTLGYEFSHATSNQTSVDWSQEQTEEHISTLNRIQNKEKEETIDFSGGHISTTVTMRNNGNVAYNLEDLTLTAYLADTRQGGRINPVASMTYLSPANSKIFPKITLVPGEITPPLNFLGEVSLDTIKNVLKKSHNLVIDPVVGSMSGNGGISFELASTNINARTAQVIVDYGVDGRPQESYRVATVAGQGYTGLSASEVMSDVLDIPYVSGVSAWNFGKDAVPGLSYRGLMQVRGVGMSDIENGYWIVSHTFPTEGGSSTITEVYNPILKNYDFDGIKLYKGHVLHMVYVQDTDRDGLGNRMEHLLGTDHLESDTDKDGLKDGIEVAGWMIVGEGGEEIHVKTDPLVPDTDGDTITDKEEYEFGTHPSKLTIINHAPVLFVDEFVVDGLEVTLTLKISDVDKNFDYLSIDWGDGETHNYSYGHPNFKVLKDDVYIVSHSYVRIGTYEISAIAYDDLNASSNNGGGEVHFEMNVDDFIVHLDFNGDYDGSFDNAHSHYHNFNLYGIEGYSVDRFGVSQYAINLSPSEASVGTYPLLYSEGMFSKINKHLLGETFTIALWLKVGGFYGTEVRIAGQGDWFNFYSNGDNKVKFGVLNGDTPNSEYSQLTSLDVATHEWELYTVTMNYDIYNNQSTMSLYRGANLQDTIIRSGSFVNPGTCYFYVGSFVENDSCKGTRSRDSGRLNVKVDDLMIFDRVLTNKEIELLNGHR